MRRSGSPFTGVGILLAKEAADQLSGVRMVLIEALVFLIALVLAWFSVTTMRESIGESPFLFLRLLTMSPGSDPVLVHRCGWADGASDRDRVWF
jgi:ABC-2 type transport system permease protein